MGIVTIIAAIIILAVFMAVISRQPDMFSVTRTATINAPAAVIFPYVNNMHKWQEWSPWAKADPEAKMAFTGPDAGVGASFKWEGNKTGHGIMTVVESRPDEYVLYRLEFLKPFKATNAADFKLEPAGSQTKVTWTMSGTNNLMGKFMGLFMNCDKMVGGQFEDGFGYLKETVNKSV